MKPKRLHHLWVAGFAGFLVACPPQKPEDTARDVARAKAGEQSEPVASIEGRPLTLAEFERRIELLPPESRSRFASVEGRKGFLEAQVQFEVLALRAEEKGYGKHPLTRDEMKQVLADELVDEAVRAEVRPADIGLDQIKAYYETHIERYKTPRRREVVALIADTVPELELLRDALARLEYKDDKQRVFTFRTFADRNTIFPELRNKGGAIGMLDDPTDPAAAKSRYSPLAETAFGLEKVGQMSAIVPFEKYVAVVMFIDEKPASVQDLSVVEDEIRDTLYALARAEARQKFIQSMTDKASVSKNEDELARIQPPKAESPIPREMLDAFGALLGYDTAESK